MISPTRLFAHIDREGIAAMGGFMKRIEKAAKSPKAKKLEKKW